MGVSFACFSEKAALQYLFEQVVTAIIYYPCIDVRPLNVSVCSAHYLPSSIPSLCSSDAVHSTAKIAVLDKD